MIEHRFQKPILAFLAVHACLEIRSGFCGFIYDVDANSVYAHEQFYWIYIAAYTISILYGIVIARVRQCRTKWEWMPWISLGYMFFDPQTENVQDILSEADRQMYQVKEAYRSRE